MPIPIAPITVGVMGSGTHEHRTLATDVGRLLARLGVNLLTGGGPGVMRAVGRAYVESPRERGVSIGIIPCNEGNPTHPKAGYPNEFVELPIYTHLPFSGPRGRDPMSRNHINVLTSKAVIALPGEAGTETEVSLAVDYGKPVVIYCPDASLVTRFIQLAPRVGTVDELNAFLAQAGIVQESRAE